MMSMARLCVQLEDSFAPLACECTLTGDHSMTVKLYKRDTGEVDLVVTGLKVSTLASPQSVEALIEELRYELESNTLSALRPAPVNVD